MLPQLKTERLSLRELCSEDAADMQAAYDPVRDCAQSAVDPTDMGDVAGRIAKYVEHRGPDNGRRLLAYVARADNELVGSVSLQRFYHPGIASLGVFVAGPHGGRGYASELCRRMLAFGFDEVGVNRIEADVALENQASLRVMEKIGMRREGVLRDCIFAQGRWWTEAKYAILKREYAPR